MLLYISRSSLILALSVFFAGLLLPTMAVADDSWYNKTEWTFSWGERSLASAVAVDIASESGAEPFTVFNPPVAGITFGEEELHEGLQYFVLQFKEDGEWGDIYEQELRIDITPPKLSVEILYDAEGYPSLQIASEDALSGIKKYMVQVGEEEYELSSEEAGAGYTFPELRAGETKVVVAVYDMAGNVTAIEKTVRVDKVLTVWSVIQNIRMYLIENSGQVNKVVITFLSLMAIFGIAFGTVEHHAHRKIRDEHRREMLRMQNSISKVFSVLRKEVRMLASMTTKKSRVTKKEKEAVEKVKQALSDSEDVIENI